MGFERCHPAINFLYFTVVLWCSITFRHPTFVAIAFFCAFAYSIQCNGRKSLLFDLALLPLSALFAVYYSRFHHFGITVLTQNHIGNNMTQESFLCGLVLGVMMVTVCIWLTCLFSVFTTDKVVYLFGKLHPRLSLFLSILLRLIPRIHKQLKQLRAARQGIGKGIHQGNPLQRLQNRLSIFSMLISWLINSIGTAAASMQSRGSRQKGRTAFSVYRFDHRDRIYVILMFFFLTLIGMATTLKQTQITFDPIIQMPPCTPLSYIFYIGYAAFCLMPLILELWTEWHFKKSIQKGHPVG